MKKIYTLILCSLFAVISFSQTSNLGGPFAWKTKAELPKNIDTKIMPGYDAEQVAQEDAINDIDKINAWRFGYKYETDFSLTNSGTWTDLPNGNRLWQIELVCENALTINLILSNLYLPEGAYLYMYDVDKTNRVGAYTSRNNRMDRILSTELVHGDKIIVEYFEPAAVVGQGHFTIANVIHGYRSLNQIQKDLTKGLEDSGDCNYDVNCPLGSGWEDQINSVAMIVVGGNGICTGALVNNTCNDGTPYFLTANHCLGGETTWAFRFNWQSPPGTEICAAVGNSADPGPPYDETANGATLLYASPNSDVALLEITNLTLTDAQNWGVFFAGWDNTDALTVTQTIAVHHPSADVKKITLNTDAIGHQVWGGAQCWYVDDWEQGITEPGSSGSPMFDQNGRIIGQLYGGGSACAGTVGNGDYDAYGRFGISWPGMSAWLAPGACGVTTTNDGYDPNTPSLPDDAGISGVLSPTGNYCTNVFNPIVTLKNNGTNTLTNVTINYDVDAGVNNVYAWTGSLAAGASTTVNLPTMTTAAGAHTFNSSTTVPNGNADSNPLNDDGASNFNVTIGAQPITMTFTTDCYGYESAWVINNTLGTTVQSGGNLAVIPGGTQTANSGDPGSFGDQGVYATTFCLAAGCYDLIVYDDWGDGLDGGGGCSTEGNYEVTEANSTVLASLITLDFNNSETQNFCIVSDIGITDAYDFNFTVYPNPANGIFTVELNGNTSEQTELILTDISGRIVEQFNLTGENKFQFDITNKASGTYYLQIISRNSISVVTIVNSK